MHALFIACSMLFLHLSRLVLFFIHWSLSIATFETGCSMARLNLFRRGSPLSDSWTQHRLRLYFFLRSLVLLNHVDLQSRVSIIVVFTNRAGTPKSETRITAR